MRIVVTAGGEPTPQELAALVVALTPVRVSGGAGPEEPTRQEGMPPWQRAALLEGCGLRAVASPSDLSAPGG